MINKDGLNYVRDLHYFAPKQVSVPTGDVKYNIQHAKKYKLKYFVVTVNDIKYLFVAEKPKTIKTSGNKKDGDNTFRTFFIDDDGNNKIRIQQNDKLIHITLLLKNDKPRRIGSVTKSTRTIVMERKRDIHLFRKGNAYGFCEYVLRTLKYADDVRLSDETTNWKIPVKFILENGYYLFFKEQGFEKQLFLSLEKLAEFEVRPEENRRI